MQYFYANFRYFAIIVVNYVYFILLMSGFSLIIVDKPRYAPLGVVHCTTPQKLRLISNK